MLAANLDLNTIQGNANISAPGSLGELISNVLPYVFGIAGILLLVYLVLGGLQLMTSRGDPKAMQGAQAKISNALLGFIIVFAAYWIVGLIGRMLNLDPIVSIFRK